MRDVVPFVPRRRIQMLDQGPTLAYIENLKAAADCEYRKILRKRFFHERVPGLEERPRLGRPRVFPPRGGRANQGPRL